MGSFAENFRALRKSLGYSQEKMADLCETNQSSISGWEVGYRTPTISTIRRIAQIFNVPVSSLISLETSGNADDEYRELLDIIQSNPKLKDLVSRARYLPNADLNMLLDMVAALTRTR